MVFQPLSHYRHVASLFDRFGPCLYGVADIRVLDPLIDGNERPFPRAIAVAVPMDAAIMSTVKTGPNTAYAEAYKTVNERIDRLCASLVTTIGAMGFRAQTFPASLRTDPVAIRGDFPHKTAATLAGLGWVGKNCQLVTRRHGPWVRLGTVFSDLPVACGKPVAESGCGNCLECVDACPAGAIKGTRWEPGVPRNALLDVRRCDRWKKERYYHFNKGHNCGICAAVCPFGK